MERSEAMNSGVTVLGADAPSPFHMAPRSSENPSQFLGSRQAAVEASLVNVGLGDILEEKKKKRGRPRKYGPDGNPLALSPMPISSSAPTVKKRGRGKLSGGFEIKMHKRLGLDNSGDPAAGTVGSNFTPHIITVNTGEDVTMKVISFSQQGPRAICILSANGVISNVTLRQPDSSGGTLTYEGRFEILSLSGSFMPTENLGTRGRTGGMSVSLVSPDGRVVGGGLAGLLIAASPIQVIVGSFLPGGGQELKPKKQKPEPVPGTVVSLPPASAFTLPPSSNHEQDDEGISGNALRNSNSGAFKQILPPRQHSYDISNWGNGQEQRSSNADINISLPAVN